jgi:hypothetical protein
MPSRKTPASGPTTDDVFLSPMDRLRQVVDALCEEPFESEAMDEDVTAGRLQMNEVTRTYYESVRARLLNTPIENAEHLEHPARERREKENPEKPPEETPPSDKR